MNRYLQYACLTAGSVLILFVVGFFFQMSWAISTWPWPDGRLSYLFMSALMAAIAAAVIWIGFSSEWGAIAGGALDLTVMAGGMGIFLLQLHDGSQPKILVMGVGALLFAAANLGLFLWSRRIPIRDPRLTPPPVRISFLCFVVVLIVTGGAMLLRTPNIMPWPFRANPDTSILMGWIFIGDALYFLYALLQAKWHGARAQLWSFLAYDLVLIIPMLQHFATVPPELRTSLTIYVGVLFFSGTVAIYYLFINKATRSASTEETVRRVENPVLTYRREG